MTAIAAICRDSEVVIAADSRRLNFSTGEETSVCKIRDLRTLFAAVSGINSYNATQFNVSALLPAEMPDVDIETNAGSIVNMLLPPLTVALEHLRNNHPDMFQRYAVQNSPLDIKFARVQDGRPTMINFSAVVAGQANEPVAIISQRNAWPVFGFINTPASSFIGTSEGVAHYLSLAHSGDLYNGDLVERARNFVQEEINKQTPEIGGSIDILRLTMDGACWIQKKDGC
jgi:hypothetical protein